MIFDNMKVKYFNDITSLTDLTSLSDFNDIDINQIVKIDNIRGSSLVNFCEPDLHHMMVSEWYNTYSSLIISLFGLIGLYYLYKNDELLDILKKNNDIEIDKKYLRESKLNRFVLYTQLFLIGLGSAYFHSNTSQFGHWIDIILISNILITSEMYLDNIICGKKKIVVAGFFLLIHLISSLCIPSIHIFFQYSIGFLLVKKINFSMKSLKNKSENNYDITQLYHKVEKKYFQIKICFGLAVIVWLIDYFSCSLIYPYHIHWIFHILIGYTGYQTIDISKYFWLTKYQEINENRV